MPKTDPDREHMKFDALRELAEQRGLDKEFVVELAKTVIEESKRNYN